MNLFGRRVGRRNERGAILVMSVAGVVLAIISAALAIDLGFLAHEARVDQKVADLAVISAIRVLPANPTVAAQQSATRNSFPFASPGYGLLVQWGPSKTGPWSSATTDLAAATAVRVTATSPHTNNFPFVPGGQSTSRSAIGTLGSKAQFSVGSKLADLNSGDNTVLNRVSSAILGTSSPVNLTVVGYQGLASGTVSLADLVAADPSLGTPDSLLTSNITVKKLALATLTALNNKAAGGDTVAAAAATPLATFANNINTNLMVKLGDILDIEQPADPASIAAKTQFSVFDLITGAGEAGMFTGTNAVSIPNLTLGIAGLATETMKLTIIEPPKISAFGPARFDASTGTWATTAHTAQVKLELNSHITVGTCIVLCVDLQMPLTVSAAKATGSLTQITCAAGSSTQQASINVVTTGANGTADNVLTVKVATLPLSLPPIISTNVGLAGGTTSPDLSFSGPPYPTAVQSTAATGAGLTTATTSQFTVLGANLGSVLGLLNPVTTAIDSQILAPTFNALGLSVGGADIKVMRIDCAVPSIAG